MIGFKMKKRVFGGCCHRERRHGGIGCTTNPYTGEREKRVNPVLARVLDKLVGAVHRRTHSSRKDRGKGALIACGSWRGAERRRGVTTWTYRKRNCVTKCGAQALARDAKRR